MSLSSWICNGVWRQTNTRTPTKWTNETSWEPKHETPDLIAGLRGATSKGTGRRGRRERRRGMEREGPPYATSWIRPWSFSQSIYYVFTCTYVCWQASYMNNKQKTQQMAITIKQEIERLSQEWHCTAAVSSVRNFASKIQTFLSDFANILFICCACSKKYTCLLRYVSLECSTVVQDRWIWPKFHLARLDSTRLDTFDFVERV